MKCAVCFLITICLVSSTQTEQEKVPATKSFTEIPTVTSGPLKQPLENVINNFGLNLLKTMMNQNENQNVVISPVGIAGLLAMTLLGSTGATYDQLSHLLGFSQDILTNRVYHQNFGSLIHDLSSNDTRTLYANAIFVDIHSKLRHVYRTYLERVYDGQALYTDFGDSNKAKEDINEWVKNHTNSKIEKFLQQPLPVNTKTVLLSALYFSGQWAEPFVPEYTRKLPFSTPTKDIMIDLMANFGQFNYIFDIDNGIQMIQFPYNDSVTSMYVIKPRFSKRLNISSVVNSLNYEKIDSLINQLSKKKCVVRFPKMELKNRIDLKDTLKALGAEAMFMPGLANFAVMLDGNGNNNVTVENLMNRMEGDGIKSQSLREVLERLPNPGVHVDSVIHEVKITIDEYGTEAVAATSAVMARSAETFYTDSPFYMFIRNDNTKLITFSAVLYDPTE